MMKSIDSKNPITDFIRFVIISPEVLALVAIAACALPFREQLLDLYPLLKNNFVAYVITPICISIGITINYSVKIRKPSTEDNNKLLFEWDGYRLIIHRCIFAIIFSFTMLAVSCIAFIGQKSIDGFIATALFLASITSTAASAISMVLAYPSINEILTKHGK